MTVLDMEQLRAVVELAKAHKGVAIATRIRDTAEDNCRELGVTDSQIGAILGYHRCTVNKRRRARQRLEVVA